MRVKIDEEEAAEESKSIYMYVYSERGGRTAIKRAASASHTNTQQNCWLKKKKRNKKWDPARRRYANIIICIFRRSVQQLLLLYFSDGGQATKTKTKNIYKREWCPHNRNVNLSAEQRSQQIQPSHPSLATSEEPTQRKKVSQTLGSAEI